MARIIIIGGHGKVAQLLTPLLVEQGDEVTSVIRNPDQSRDVEALGAAARVADIEQLDTASLTDILAGHDAVVWSAGAGGGNPARTDAVDRRAAIRTMDAALGAGVARYVMVSYFGARTDHGVDPSNSFFAYAEAKAAADAYLRTTALDWTILGPSHLTLGEATGEIDTAASESGEVSRANVASVIRAVLAEPATIRRTIRFNDGTVPIADALR